MFFVPAVAASVGIPYLASNVGGKGESGPANAQPGGDSSGGLAADLATLTEGGDSSGLVPLDPHDLPVQGFGEILRWEVTPRWVLERWPRVSTHLREGEWNGYRVAVFTGTSEFDAAGALTYYFNAAGELRRITFAGMTGDPRVLVSHVERFHGLEQRVVDDPAVTLYESRRLGSVLGELRVKPTGVIRSEAWNVRYQVNLRLDNPESGQSPFAGLHWR
jgi:hypothetical protein